MITTKTGAKKLEANDNWAKIVPNAQGQDSAHNDSVEAHDSVIESLCQTISGTTNNCGHTINSGEYFIANGGKYKATATIPVNQAWSGSAQAVSDNDLINALNNRITTLNSKTNTGLIIRGSNAIFTNIRSGVVINDAYTSAFKNSNICIIMIAFNVNTTVPAWERVFDLKLADYPELTPYTDHYCSQGPAGEVAQILQSGGINTKESLDVRLHTWTLVYPTKN